MKEKLYSDSYISIRRNPKNLIEEDKVLFAHELRKDIESVKNVTLNNIYATAKDIVITKQKLILPDIFSKSTSRVVLPEFKFYIQLFKTIIRNRFVIVKTPVIFIVEKFSSNYFHWITEA